MAGSENKTELNNNSQVFEKIYGIDKVLFKSGWCYALGNNSGHKIMYQIFLNRSHSRCSRPFVSTYGCLSETLFNTGISPRAPFINGCIFSSKLLISYNKHKALDIVSYHKLLTSRATWKNIKFRSLCWFELDKRLL